MTARVCAYLSADRAARSVYVEPAQPPRHLYINKLEPPRTQIAPELEAGPVEPIVKGDMKDLRPVRHF